MTATRSSQAIDPVGPASLVAEAAGGRAQTLLAEAGLRLSGALNLRRCLHAVAELAVAYLADAAVVVGPPTRSRTMWVRLAAGGRVEEDSVPEHDVTRVSGIAEALSSYPPAENRRLGGSAAPAWLLPGGTDTTAGLLVVSIPGRALPGGAMVLARAAGQRSFTDDEESLARAFAFLAGAAISAAELYHEQAEAVGALRADLEPPRLPHLDGIELAGSYQPAGYGLLPGGDFYDLFAPSGPGGRTIVVLGDVCGKGVRAAAATGKVRQTLRALHLVEERPAELLRVLNKALLESSEEGPFVTVDIGSMALTARGTVELTFATGGHPPPLVLRRDGSVGQVPAAGTLIGVTDELRIQTASTELAPGELCLLYSDGVTEARAGATGKEEFGEHRLRRGLASCLGTPAEVTIERLRQLLSDWVGGSVTRDDIVMLAIRAQAGGSL